MTPGGAASLIYKSGEPTGEELLKEHGGDSVRGHVQKANPPQSNASKSESASKSKLLYCGESTSWLQAWKDPPAGRSLKAPGPCMGSSGARVARGEGGAQALR